MADETPLNELPEPDYKDRLRDAIVIGSALIPLPVSNILDRFLPSSLANRQKKWQEIVADGIVKLQKEFDVMPETLIQSPVFTTALIEATWIAIRHHQEEQLNYLRNMVLNSSLPNSPDDDIQKVFFRLINEFTPTHIKVFEYFVFDPRDIKPPAPYDKHQRYYARDLLDPNFYTGISEKLPALKDQDAFIQLIVDDLIGSNLLEISPWRAYNEKLRLQITAWGGGFYGFVMPPKK